MDHKGSRLSPENGCDSPINLLMGASTPFGFGATSDATTIASYFSKNQKLPWYNLAVPGFTLPQSIIHLMFLLPRLRSVKKIVIIGGVTDLNHFFRTPLYPKLFGSFYQFMDYFSKLNTNYFDSKTNEIKMPSDFTELYAENNDPSNSYDNFTDSLRNSLNILAFFARSLGAELVFVLQPVVKWMDREPSPEELRLIYDKPENHKAMFKLTAEAYKQWYRDALENICDELNIEYINLNNYFPISEKSSNWLFIDNVHFHDQGSALAAEIINNECSFM